MTTVPTVPQPQPCSARDLLIALDLRAGAVRLVGDLDRSCAHHLTDAVLAVAASGASVWTLDLRDLGFCDVEGLRVLHRAQELARAQGRVLRLHHVPPLVGQLLPLMGPAGHAELIGDRGPAHPVCTAG